MSDATPILYLSPPGWSQRDLRGMLNAAGFEVVVHQGLDGLMPLDERSPLLVPIDQPQLEQLDPLAQWLKQRRCPVVVVMADRHPELATRYGQQGLTLFAMATPSPAGLASLIGTARRAFDERENLRAELRRAQLRLLERRTIAKAQFRLMESKGLTEAGAYEWLKQKAMSQRLSMAAVAEKVLAEQPLQPQ